MTARMMAKRVLNLQEGWLTFGLLLVMNVTLVASVQAVNWVEGTEVLYLFILIGALTGVALAKSPLPSKLGVVVGLVLGVEFILWIMADLTPAFSGAFGELGRVPGFLWEALRGHLVLPVPFNDAIYSLWERGWGFYWRIFGAISLALEGQVNSDVILFMLVLAAASWVAAFYSAWRLYRHSDATVAILPAGLALGANVFFSGIDIIYMTIYLLAALILLLRMNIFLRQMKWAKEKVDFPDELLPEVLIVGVGLILVTALGGRWLPTITSNPLARAFWIYFDQPWGRIEEVTQRLFAGVNNPTRSPLAGVRGTIPLGGSRGDSDQVYMYVQTSELDSIDFAAAAASEDDAASLAPFHYWRGGVFDRYDGHSWNASPLKPSERDAQAPVVPNLAERAVLTQTVTIVGPRAGLVYAANQAVKVDKPYTVYGWNENDYSALTTSGAPASTNVPMSPSTLLSRAGLRVTNSNLSYTVTSYLPDGTEQDLRAAGNEYPDWVKERYLQLPTSLPKRVGELAHSLADGKGNAYDKALAIEDYLRRMEYSLDIKAAPNNRDAVDYFLFDLQKGYCDYFASAMIVMLRSVGVPARFASGFAKGNFDTAGKRYEVTLASAHSWPEVYFPGQGWVEFEPSAINPPVSRPLPPAGPTEEATPTPEPTEPSGEPIGSGGWLARILADFVSTPLWILLVAVALVAFLAAQLRSWQIRRMPARAYVQLVFTQMCREGAYLGVSKPDSDTPLEYADHLARELERLPRPMRLVGLRIAATASDPTADLAVVRRIAADFVELMYGRREILPSERQVLESEWNALRGRMRWWRFAPKARGAVRPIGASVGVSGR